MLSTRGQSKANQPLRPDFALFDEAMKNPYTPENTDGAITLCIAENLLQWEELKVKFQSITREREWPEWLAAYAPMAGHGDFRQAVAKFVGNHIAGVPLNPDFFCGSAGATATVELTAMSLGDPGDYAVFPAPAYQAYEPDVAAKAGLERYNIETYAREWSADYHPLAVEDLQNVLGKIGDRFAMLILTQPDNPTGAIYAESQLEDIATWCERQGIHLIVNEIYALSQFSRQHSEIENKAPYTSFLPLLEERQSDCLHWWYSFSKDFGISGFRVGLLYSHNEQLRKAYTNFNAPHQIGNLSQWLVTELLKDDDWVSNYQQRNKKLLTEAYLTVTRTLDQLSIPYSPARGSLFVWADFSGKLQEKSEQQSEALWEAIFRETGVLLTAPGGLGQPEVGWFRVVYSSVANEALREAMKRLEIFFSD